MSSLGCGNEYKRIENAVIFVFGVNESSGRPESKPVVVKEEVEKSKKRKKHAHIYTLQTLECHRSQKETMKRQ